MFSLIHGNRQEDLARQLAARLRAAPQPLFTEEAVVVQSAAMERWLRLFLAEELGIAAQLRFPFPASYIWDLFGAVLPAIPRNSPLAPERLHWRLLRLLGQPRRGKQFDPLNHYLEGGDLRRRDGLARQLAATFDRYLTFRPDWLAAWSQQRLLGLGMHEAWQAALWRELAAELALPEAHPRDAFFQALAADPGLIKRLPARISLFGIGNLPPAYLEVFQELGRHLDVRLYLLDPCAEYWGDLVASRDKARLALSQPGQAVYLDVGHPLLGSFGRLTRQFLDRLVADGAELEEAFVEPDTNTLLGRLQHDLLTLQETPAPLADDDRSLQVHVCHGPRREVEVLHDQLLARFAADPTLRPSDVLVLTPDIEAFAPLVDAVFATRPVARRIPYTIADRPAGRQAPLLQAFFALLELAAGRLEAEAVLQLLEQPAVARRHGMDEADLERVRDWVRAAAIRWGVDGEWRAAQGLPADAGYSWRHGLERLLLGVALAPEDGLFDGRLAAAEIPGGAAQLLGRLISFADDLFAAHGLLNQAHSLDRWAELLEQWLARFFDSQQEPADLRAAQALHHAWQGIASEAAAAGCVDAVPLAVVRRALEDALQEIAPSHGFIGGGVTFAALRAWRAVPARVICLLGMNDGAFPRNPVMPGFDLCVSHPRAGDRAPRDEDRQALLDVLLSVREALLISYAGRGIRDNAHLPPASVVAEVLDAVARGGGEAALERITTVHPLQPFSRRYFDGAATALFSYEEDYAAASRSAAQRTGQGGTTGFLDGPLPAPEDDDGLLDLTPDELIRFLLSPARALLRDRLGIRLEESEGLLESAEPFVIAGRERMQLETALVADACTGADVSSAFALAAARGALPLGPVGASQFEERWRALQGFAGRVREGLRVADGNVPVSFEAHGLRISGRLGGLGAEGLLLWRTGDARGPDLLRLWVHHLLLNVAAPAGVAPLSRLLTPAETYAMAPLENAAVLLADLLALYQRGRCELLPFLPRTGYAYASGEPRWRAEWQRDEGWCEALDPWFDLAWNGGDPCGAEFEALAQRVYAPLLAALNA
ncbi:MAG TPA: exodeoxyribonuclease V subunit gamma [Rhodocyclaceae bacterium]